MGLAGAAGWLLTEMFLAGGWILDFIFRDDGHSDPDGSRRPSA